jgi:cytoskeletal protein RodZ
MKEIGQEIQKARTKKEITLEEIADRTKINVAHLRDIENGRFDFLPRPYVVAFVKTFARYVGLDGEALVRRWREQEQAASLHFQEQQMPRPAQTPATAKRPSITPDSEKAKISLRFPALEQIPYLKEISIGFGIILVIAVLLYLMLQSGRENAANERHNQPKQSQSSEQVSAKEIPFSEVSQEVAAKTQAVPPPAPVLLTLEARFEEPTRMRVISDSVTVSDMVYTAGQSKTWQAKEKFSVRIGNAGAVTLLLDGNDLGKAGQRGLIAYFVITREGIVDKRFVRPRPRPVNPQDTLRAPRQ